MRDFAEEYRRLNDAQRQAVDTIEGPVLVIAGPGTGKTQLLSMRAANILRKTDTSAHNVLCLTFTDSAAAAMRKRLVQLMGQTGMHIPVHTFHSFGTEIINRYPEYFYQGANFQPANELSSYEILEDIFETLAHNDPLALQVNGQFAALKDTQQAIGYLKKAGVDPDELEQIIAKNEQFISFAEPILAATFDIPRLGLKDVAACQEALKALTAFRDDPILPFVRPLHEVCIAGLQHALAATEEDRSTKPLTEWRNSWLERDHKKHYILKDRTRSAKLRTVVRIYRQYQEELAARQLFDFEDMIMKVVHTMEQQPELRFNLQEQFLYIMVDEFQDTNLAQLRLLRNILENEVNNNRPDVMVVGDDDQAIYAFQGAEISNILQFKNLYQNPAVISLVENYRSSDIILKQAREVIVQGEFRLETSLENINKELHANATFPETSSETHLFSDPDSQHRWVANHIKRLIDQGNDPGEIALLARNHKQLTAILPFLHEAKIAVDYERRNDVLQTEIVQALVVLARVVDYLSKNLFDEVDGLLPELLSFPFWGISNQAIWQLSLDAYRDSRFWLERMLEHDDALHQIADFLILASRQALHKPFDQMLDILLGNYEDQLPDSDEEEPETNTLETVNLHYVSPLRAHYFSELKLERSPDEYINNLNAISTIRHRAQEYAASQTLLLTDFVQFIDLHAKTSIGIVNSSEEYEGEKAIKLMTAHKAKGLEFDYVFVLSCQDEIWGMSARHRHSLVRFPTNLEIEPAGQTDDDCLRLFYVAMTRARHHLFLCGYKVDESGRQSNSAAFLLNCSCPSTEHETTPGQIHKMASATNDWKIRHVTQSGLADWKDFLRPTLSNYQISATHLNNFIDVTRDGPRAFLLQNLLRFPQSPSSNAVFGSLIHYVFKRAHVHLSQTGEARPIEDILHDYELQLQRAHLAPKDQLQLLDKGSAVLNRYFLEQYDQFKPHQKAEYPLRNINIEGVITTGTIDMIEIDEQGKSLTIVDYKTGRVNKGWQGPSDYDKIKLHKYKQQMLFYKLMIEQSGEFGNKEVKQCIVDFVEHDSTAPYRRLEMTFDEKDRERFIKLLQAVWGHIKNLDFPDVNLYEKNHKGLLMFEDDLIVGKI